MTTSMFYIRVFSNASLKANPVYDEFRVEAETLAEVHRTLIEMYGEDFDGYASIYEEEESPLPMVFYFGGGRP